jgi:D-glycero-D-manno-heptose 1,7-bisphosphate phosphatase
VIELLILDRDGVINEKIKNGYVKSISELIFIDSTFIFLSQHLTEFMNIAVITNQQGISKKLFDINDLVAIHEKVSDKFNEFGLPTPTYFVCPHLAGTCDCRKPSPSLIFEALDHFKSQRGSTLMIGDSESDIEAARNAGIDSIHLNLACDASECYARSHELHAGIFR